MSGPTNVDAPKVKPLTRGTHKVDYSEYESYMSGDDAETEKKRDKFWLTALAWVIVIAGITVLGIYFWIVAVVWTVNFATKFGWIH